MAELPARVVTAQGVLLKDWGEATAVAFVTGSAATHHLTAQAAGILQRCIEAADTHALAADDETLLALLDAGLLQPAE